MARNRKCILLALLTFAGLAIVACGSNSDPTGGMGSGDGTVLQPGVRLLSDAETDEDVAVIQPDSLVFQASAAAPTVGTVLVSGRDAGLLRRVEAVTENADGSHTATTSQAALTDVFQDVEVHEEVVLEAPQGRRVVPMDRGSYVIAPVRAEGRVDIPIASHELQITLPLVQHGGASVELEGSVELGLTAHFDLVVARGRLEALRFTMEPAAAAMLALNAVGELVTPLHEERFNLPTVTIATVTIWVPTPIGIPVPIVFTFNLTPFIQNVLELRTTGTLALAQLSGGIAVEVGFEVDRSLDIDPISKVNEDPFDLTGLIPDLAKADPDEPTSLGPLIDLLQSTNLEFKLADRTGIGLEFDVLLYDVIGPYVDLQLIEHEVSGAVSLNLGAGPHDGPELVLDSLVRCRPFQRAGARLEIFNRELVDLSLELDAIDVKFERHLPLFPVTVPLGGTLAVTAE